MSMVFQKCWSHICSFVETFFRTPESVPQKIPWPIDSPSQEIHHERLELSLNHGQEQHARGQREEAQTRLRVMMIVLLYKVEEFIPSRTLREWQILHS